MPGKANVSVWRMIVFAATIVGMSSPLTSLFAETKTNAEPVVYLAIFSDSHSIPDLSDFAERQIRDRLRNLGGVADVSILGERRFSLRIRIDAARLTALGLETRDVEAALSGQNIPASSVNKSHELIEFILPSLEKAPSMETVGKIAVKKKGGEVSIPLANIATIELGMEDEIVTVTYKGKPAVALGLIKKWWVVTPVILLNLRSAMPTIRSLLPPGINVEATYRSSLQIEVK